MFKTNKIMKSSSLGFNGARPPTSKRPLGEPEISCINRPKRSGMVRILPVSISESNQCCKASLCLLLFLFVCAAISGIGYGISEAIRAENVVTLIPPEPLELIESVIPIDSPLETPSQTLPLQPCSGCTRRRS